MKKKIIIPVLIFGSINVLVSQPLPRAKIDSIEKIIIREMSRQHIPGLSIAIAIDSTIVWQNGYGFADIENLIPVTTSTKFRSASVGKPLTATAIMQLKEKGLIDLDATVQKYYPSFPSKRWPVSIFHLLTHQSGLRPYRAEEVVNTKHYNNVFEPLQIFRNDSLLFKPGTRHSYTSFNYNLLGCVLQEASGMDYATYMQQYIFGPATMYNTVIDDNYSIIPGRARGYRWDQEKNRLLNAEQHDPSDRIPAGGFLTTSQDLVKFAISSYRGRLVSEKTFAEMINNPKLPDGSFASYGFGWGCYEPTDNFFGFTEINHGGQTPGVSNMLLVLLSPSRKFAIAIMTNREGFSRRGDICEEIARVVLDLSKK